MELWKSYLPLRGKKARFTTDHLHSSSVGLIDTFKSLRTCRVIYNGNKNE